METMILAFVVLVVLVAGMAVGVIFGRKPISGSCGGMSALGMDVACDICKGDPEVCETEQQKAIKAEQQQAEAEDLSYDASK